LGVEAAKSVDATVAGVAEGFVCKYNAATPATCGAAIDVPDIEVMSVVLRMYDDVTETPGANTSTHEPKFEKLARTSVEPVAPTVMAKGSLAGEAPHALALLLPAATTMVMPSATARATAAFRALDNPPPKLMFATAGVPAMWFVMAHSIPAMTPDVEPQPVHDKTRIGTSCADFATP
jgi:hypothetical protein